jgi:nucleoid DNA-binding protein
MKGWFSQQFPRELKQNQLAFCITKQRRNLTIMAIKKTSKKVVAKKAVKKAKKPVAAKKVIKAKKVAKPVKAVAVKKGPVTVKTPFTRSQTLQHLADVTGVKKKEVSQVLEAVGDLIQAHLSKKGPGEMNFAGLLKCRVIHKPATKARQGKNPFTGEMMTFSAKPARNVIKIRPLKKLKEAVG